MECWFQTWLSLSLHVHCSQLSEIALIGGELMAIHDHWIYQRRESADPWVFYVVREYDRRVGKQADVINYTFYSENIENATHSVSKVGLHYENVTGYVDEMLSTMCDYASVTNEDIAQLTIEMQDILMY